MIEAEVESSQKGERKETRIIPENYDFRLVGTEASDGRDSYVLEISPKKPTKFSIRGRIWVDAEDFAIARRPAREEPFVLDFEACRWCNGTGALINSGCLP